MNVFSLAIDLVWSMGNHMELFSVTVQRDCNRARMASRSEIGTITAIAWQRTNHLGPFSGASDWSESKELGGLAVGGQGLLQGVKWYLWFWTSYKLDFGVKPSVLGYGESFGLIFRSLISIGRSKTRSRGSRRPRRPEHTQVSRLS